MGVLHGPATPTCVACSAPRLPAGVRCEACGAWTGWLRPGEHFYWRRFELHELLSARPGLVRWRVTDRVSGHEGILCEYAGQAELAPEQQQGLIRRASDMARWTEIFDPPEYAFTYRGRPFLFRRLAPRTTLLDLAAAGKVREIDAARLFFTLVQHLGRMMQLSPPLSIGGAIHADEVVQAEDGGYRLACVPSAVGEPGRDAAVRDLRAIAALTCRVLEPGGDSADSPVQRWRERAARIEEDGFAAALEWLISDIAPPQNSSDLVRLAAMVREGTGLLQEGKQEQAWRCLEGAARMANVPRVRRLLDRIESARKSSPAVREQRQTGPAPAASKDFASKSEAAETGGKPKGGAPEQTAVPSPTAPEKAPAAVAAVPARSFKLCLQCGRKFDSNRIFCEHDGSRLVEAQEGRGTPAAKPGPDVAAQTSTHFHITEPTPEPRLKKNVKWLAALAAAAVVVLFFFWISGADRREFIRMVESNRLVSASGPSAYSVYRRLRQSRGAEDSLVRELGERVRYKLNQLSEMKFDQWRRSSDIQPLTWAEMVQLEEWRTLLDGAADNQARLAYARGMAALASGDANGAEGYFHEALRLKPGWALPLNGLGRVNFQLSRFSQAEKYYQEAARSDPSWAFPHINLANLYRDVFRRFDEAEQQYRRAIELQPDRCSFHQALGNFYFARGAGFRQKACEAYQNALARLESGGCTQADADLARRRVARYCQP